MSLYIYSTKTNNKYMEGYDKNKASLYYKYWHINNLYGSAMSWKFPINNFEWIKDTSQDFIKTIMKKGIKNIFSKCMFSILKKYMNLTMIYHFNQKE